ncbi:hypothetical protein B0T18DRAFT_417511 [Schizothecium vesticola]|uniref:Genetic interactor of prohibitins 3, mitochondrial n=1 Tax=Schizothecium vesticola TaxID=314040 RepID=A0AA40JYZ0_9PEZI|nr:hypothetical protein B0T18DRAFT_417511 [Schizothecium vesticola]
MQAQRCRSLYSKLLGNIYNLERCSSPARLSPFLCPTLLRAHSSTTPRRPSHRQNGPLLLSQARRLHTSPTLRTEAHPDPEQPQAETRPPIKSLPPICTGCGALSQTTMPNEPGYYSLDRGAVAEYLGLAEKHKPEPGTQDDVVRQALADLDLDDLEAQGVNLRGLAPDAAVDDEPDAARTDDTVICDRCHGLLHHGIGQPIFHPSIDALRNTIAESPYKYNHIYHLLDAADFPMSLLPKITDLLDAMPLRSHNRRSRSAKYYANKKTEISFIITRADLLGAKKEDVDRLMPALRETLREALGRNGAHVRLGNVKCVSAKRGWWTKPLKEEIFSHRGAAWMVGKANVGKSHLFAAVFPQGRMDHKPSPYEAPIEPVPGYGVDESKLDNRDDDLSLLPPARPETQYPAMPLISPLAGTTASPIRLTYGGGKGELIDLPGLPRTDLELYVQEEHRNSLILRKRKKPEQVVLKPGKSLLLGGFIRITPQTPGLDFLAYNFTPLTDHLTSTEKAIGVQERTDPVNVDNISVPEASDKIKLAGSYELRYDITKQRAGPLTRKNAINLPVERLPFRVLSVDILIEGCGWVEITAQMSARKLEAGGGGGGRKLPPPVRAPPAQRKSIWNQDPARLDFLDLSDPDEVKPQLAFEPDEAPNQFEEGPRRELNWPVVDVFTPEGRFVAARRAFAAYDLNKTIPKGTKMRPRKSMKGHKKRMKQESRARG